MKNSEKKGSEGMDSVIEHSGYLKPFKKNESDASSNNKLLSEDYEENDDSGSVIVRDEKNNNNNGHSRNCSEISGSSVLVKNND